MGIGMFRIAIVAAVLSTLVVQADPPEAKAPPKPLSPRDYLPTLLLKTQLDATRDYAASLESLFKLAQSLSDAGFVPAAQTRQVERELLQTRIDLLKKDREHLDALDQYQAKSDVSPEHMRELEETTFGVAAAGPKIRAPSARTWKPWARRSTSTTIRTACKNFVEP